MSTRLDAPPGAADPRYSYRSVGIRVLADAASSGGALSVVEHTVPPMRLPMPPVRGRATIALVVLDGALTVQHGDAPRVLHVGECVIVPAGDWHARWNGSDEPVRFHEIATPGGIEGWYRAIAGIIPPEPPADVSRVLALAADYGLEFDMAALYELTERYNVRLV